VGSCQLPVASCQLPVASCQLPVASCQLPVASCQLPVASCWVAGGPWAVGSGWWRVASGSRPMIGGCWPIRSVLATFRCPRGFLWFALEEVAECGYRRRIFGGMAQVSRCGLAVGQWLPRLLEPREAGLGSAGTQPTMGNRSLRCIRPLANLTHERPPFLEKTVGHLRDASENPASQAALACGVAPKWF
jgi:hypothetical protein